MYVKSPWVTINSFIVGYSVGTTLNILIRGPPVTGTPVVSRTDRWYAGLIDISEVLTGETVTVLRFSMYLLA